MAHGGSHYNLRDVTKTKTTLSLSEDDRLRHRKHKRTEEELAMFQQKRDEITQLRRAASSIRIDADTDNVRLDSGTDEEFDISAETRKLQDKLAHLQDEQQNLEEREDVTVTPKGRLPKVKSRTDEIVRTEDRRDPKTEETLLQWDLYRKTEEIDKINKLLLNSERTITLLQLELKENKLKNFEETEKRDLRLKRHEEQLIKLQQKIDDRLSDLEEREQKLAERSKRLEEREQQITDTNRPYSRCKERDEIDSRIRQLEQQKTRLEAGFLEEGQDTIRSPTITNHNAREFNEKVILTPFSGKEPVPKNEASFEEFKLEFESIRHIYSEHILQQSLRKALRDQARKCMLHLGTHATIDDIVKSLEENFGNVASEDCILSRFLLAEQKTEESIVEWGLRLEDMLLQVGRRTRMTEAERNKKLKNRLWRGLKNDELRHATRTYFESEMTYEELRNKIRGEEYEIKLERERTSNRNRTAKLHQTSVESHESEVMVKVLQRLEDLERKIDEFNNIQPHYDAMESRTQRGGMRQNTRYRSGYRNRGRGGYQGNRREDQAQPDVNSVNNQHPLN